MDTNTSKTPRFGEAHAVVVAIASYKEITPLPEAVLNDGRDVAAVLTSDQHCGYDRKNVRVLLDSDATLARVREALAAIANTSGPNDTVVLFFSGHGALLGDPAEPRSALLPFDCVARRIDSTCLPESEFSEALDRIKARRLLVLLDACHAGGAGSFKGAGPNDPITLGYSEKALTRLGHGAGRVLVASCRANETSLVMHGSRNSVFSEHLLSALRGKAKTQGDGLIRVFDLFNYVAERVGAAVPGLQHPIFKASDLETNFPIALDCGGIKTITRGSSPEPAKKVDVWRDVERVLSDLYPMGPTDQDIWTRAGGDVSRLQLNSTGRANWFGALRTLRLGGGGEDIQLSRLVTTALEDYPHHPDLSQLLDRSQ